MEQKLKENKTGYPTTMDKKNSIYLTYDNRTLFFSYLFSAFMTIEEYYDDLEVYF